MPPFSFSFHWPRFLCLHPRSPQPSPAGPSDDASSNLPCSPALPVSLSYGHGVPPKDIDAVVTSTSPESSAPENAADHQSSTSQPIGKAPDDQIGVVASDSAQMFGPHPTTLQHACPRNPTYNATPSRLFPVPQCSPYPSLTSSQQAFRRQNWTQVSDQNSGMFNQAHDFTVTGTFIEHHATFNNIYSNQFMEKLLQETIRGAEFDSSARDPPPRCHPGTRLTILDRCLNFIQTCDGQKKIRWVVGAAGVGKSAVMQNVAESPQLPVSSHASVFFSVNGRNDGTKMIVTLAYQFAAKSDLYRELIEKEITRDPSLLRSSMVKQFLKFIIEPFVHNARLNSAGRVLIIIDGLDECNNSRVQLDLLRLISDICLNYPSSPLVWLIASRPETHITSFFSNAKVVPAYEKEEIPVDSDEGRADVERFLRDELIEIRDGSDSLNSQWPEERDFWKLANAAGGLFAYAQTAIRYIGDPNIGSPASQLSDVLDVIDNLPMTDVPREEHPMALLDALYARILSHIPSKTMVNTRKLLLALSSRQDKLNSGSKSNFIVLCNWLGMTPDEAYAALNSLRSVLHVPRRDKAHRENLEPFHKSFIDYICDFTRSGFSRDVKREAWQLEVQCIIRVLNEALDGIDFGDVDYGVFDGQLARGPGTGDKISLSWPVDEIDWNNNRVRLSIYKFAIRGVAGGMKFGDPMFQNEFCVRLLITRFRSYFRSFPYDELRDFVFHESRRHEFMTQGILKQTSFREIDLSQTIHDLEVKMQFRCPAAVKPNSSSCVHHERIGVWEEGKEQNWTTVFWWDSCTSCFSRLKRQLEIWTAHTPDHCVPVLSSSTGECCVEIRFVDSDDGMSDWTYWFWVDLPMDEHNKT